MFKANTLFILGAGASKPYGFPLGKELVHTIIDDMDDTIYIPTYYGGSNATPHFNSNDIKNNTIYNFDKILDNIKKFYLLWDKISSNDLEIYNENHMNLFYRNLVYNFNQPVFPVKIKYIDIFMKLKKALIEIDPVSIDAFLRDNPSHERAGKIMIIYALLKREDLSKFERSKSVYADNWYSLLYNDLVSDCAEKPETLLENNIRIITFNYDTSLDYHLTSRLFNTERFNERNSSQSVAERFISALSIKHVYGACYNQEQLTYGELSQSSGSITVKHPSPLFVNEIFYNFKRFFFADINYLNIKTMYPERKELDYSGDLLWANEVIIIGFGFDRTNLDLLGFSQQQGELEAQFQGKTVRFLNYEGNMKSLSKEFQELSNFSAKISYNENPSNEPIARFKLIESTAKKISDAYLNDFKKYLFL